MKKFISMIAILFFTFVLIGCEEKSDMEKAQDSMKNAFEHTKDAVKDATK